MAYDIFLRIKGIKGDSTDEKHKEWIEIKSYSHQIDKPRAAVWTGGPDQVGGSTNHYDFEILKKLDLASPMIFQYCHNTTHIQRVDVELCRATGDKTPFMKYTLGNAVITEVQAQGTDDDTDALPMEKIKLRYRRIDLEYTATSPEGGGKKGATISVSIDLGE